MPAVGISIEQALEEKKCRTLAAPSLSTQADLLPALDFESQTVEHLLSQVQRVVEVNILEADGPLEFRGYELPSKNKADGPMHPRRCHALRQIGSRIGILFLPILCGIRNHAECLFDGLVIICIQGHTRLNERGPISIDCLELAKGTGKLLLGPNCEPDGSATLDIGIWLNLALSIEVLHNTIERVEHFQYLRDEIEKVLEAASEMEPHLKQKDSDIVKLHGACRNARGAEVAEATDIGEEQEVARMHGQHDHYFCLP
mmetsp:Transcript_125995/g.268839  ORF Transcript_125995/g.268839 Transcript_125995/m.268839 type:complete len:258 (-) Transcript_125995:641-1414(-)